LRVRATRALSFHSPWIYTMNRCASLVLALAAAALAPAAASAQDQALAQRTFPKNALRGSILFGNPPAIQLNGDTALMAAGYRVHGPDNLIVMATQLVGFKGAVDYTTDMQGQVREVWLLTPAESARLWPTTPEEAATWSFQPDTQTWTKP
jgi:hypothetical protein